MEQANPPRKIARAWRVMLWGGCWFWGPEVILHAVRGPDSSLGDIIALNILLPSTAIAAFVLLRRWEQRAVSAYHDAWLLVAGMWALGPWMMAVGTSVRGDGYLALLAADPMTTILMLAVSTVFPFYTFIMATHDGTLAALMGASLALPLIGLAIASKDTAARRPRS